MEVKSISMLTLLFLGNLQHSEGISGHFLEKFQNRQSMTESLGLISEDAETWQHRRDRQRRQMIVQEDVYRNHKNMGPPKDFWQFHYEPTFSCPAEERMGSAGDGGKWVCEPYQLTKKAESANQDEGCLVYSVGSSGRYDFEQSVFDSISEKCEIHTFDLANWTQYTDVAPPSFMNYHVRTVGPEPNTPIPAIVKQLGHVNRTIDLFKIDCEGCEWETYKTWLGSGVDIRQILVEVHGGVWPGGGAMSGHPPPEVHDFFRTLFQLGYVVFHKEPNISGCQGACVEYAFVKLDPSFSQLTGYYNTLSGMTEQEASWDVAHAQARLT